MIYRPKTGFGVPLRAWLRGPLRALLRDFLTPSIVSRRGLIEPRAAARLLTEFETRRADHAYSLLSLMCVELWQRIGEAARRLAEENFDVHRNAAGLLALYLQLTSPGVAGGTCP